MTDSIIRKSRRRWLVPEVVQTSAMDCGPASLKCLLEGFHIPVSYGRLREACQTSVDGTSIDRLEEVANQLGVVAEQVMLPLDHVLLPAADVLPAMVVSKHPDGATHFMVLWRRLGGWVQVMDPATGRRWIRTHALLNEIFRHEHTVAAADWRDWAASDAFLIPLQQRLKRIGAPAQEGQQWVDQALGDRQWFGLAKLDAATRLVQALIEANGIRAGTSAIKLLQTVFKQIDQDDIYRHVPVTYWSVTPQLTIDGSKQLRLRGAVLLTIKPADTVNGIADQNELPPELEAALHEKPSHPAQTLLALLKADGLLAPLALMMALTVSAAAVLLESLLFRGIFDIAWELRSVEQRLLALLALLSFSSLLLLIEIPIVIQALRIGRHLESRLRAALLEKLPRLNDRYFQSRPISDMAERGHSIALTRSLPNLGVQLLQTLWDLLFTLVGIVLLDQHSALWAFGVTLFAMGLPMLLQPLLNERDLRVRSHSGALFSFYLDALLGLVPIRAHSAERAVRREHEGLLSEWSRAGQSLIRVLLVTEGMQALICTALVCAMLYQHFVRAGSIMGGDLLLIYWALKLPAIGQRLSSLAHQYPAQRNSLLRLLEPLTSPEDLETPDQSDEQDNAALVSPARIQIRDVNVLAAGHALLQGIDVQIQPGEHVAVVGASGAGKSTLMGLLLGWHKPSEGQLLVDGAALSGHGLTQLRQHTAWVDPGIQLWNRSLLDNLSFSCPEYKQDRLGQVLDVAALRGVLQKLPAGLQTYLGEGGGLLSGGEGQRLRLARALLQEQVRLVLLDEPFRGVDRQHRQQLLGDVRQWWQASTLLCVTHDIEETLTFDRVLVIDQAELVEDGKPADLLDKASRYRDLLTAERELRKQMWAGSHWRCWQLAEGQLQEVADD